MFATKGFSSGTEYWEVTLNQMQGTQCAFVGLAIRQEPATLGVMREVYGILGPEEKLFYRYPSQGQYAMPQFGNRK